MNDQFTIDDLVCVAKRENNAKRSYLYVNPFQGKHIPAPPGKVLSLFGQLQELLEQHWGDERLLLIGFAETATAIGGYLAYRAQNAAYFLTTTREETPGAEVLPFTESHSHAAEQKLILDGLAALMPDVQRVVFVEDEVTTGNTIEKLMEGLRRHFPALRFGILSILSSMPETRIADFARKGVPCVCLHRIPQNYQVETLEVHHYAPPPPPPSEKTSLTVRELILSRAAWDARTAAPTAQVRSGCDAFVAESLDKISLPQSVERILVLGTEEFMLPPLLLAQALQEACPEAAVRFHATTRSPILTSPDVDYPFHNRAALDSFYAPGRPTFLYNLAQYDRVYIGTDAPKLNPGGVSSLLHALEAYSKPAVTLLRWRASP